MGTKLQWSRTGLLLVCETSSRALPKPIPSPVLVPDFSQVASSLLTLTLETVTGATRKGIRVKSTSVDGLPHNGPWTLWHREGTGDWEGIDLGGGNRVDYLLADATPSVVHGFKLSGKGATYPETTITTGADPLVVDFAAMTSDSKITDAEKVQLRRWLEDQRQKWVSAYDAAVAAGFSTTADPLQGRRDSLWKTAFAYFASVLYSTTGSYDAYGCIGLGAARTGTANIYPNQAAYDAAIAGGDALAINYNAWFTMLTGLQNAPLAVRSDIAAKAATASTLGLVKPGAGLSVAADGTLQLVGGVSASWAGLAGAPTDSTPLMTLLGGKAAASHSHTNADLPAYPTLSSLGAVGTGDARLTDSRPASDVYAWAKAATKPSYTYSEVGAVGTGDARLTDSRPASDVYAWAKAATKPSYTYSEVGALGATATAADSSKLGGQAPSYYQPALGFTPINKAGDAMTGSLGFDVTTGELDLYAKVSGAMKWGMFLNSYRCGLYDWANDRNILNYDATANTVAIPAAVFTGALTAVSGQIGGADLITAFNVAQNRADSNFAGITVVNGTFLGTPKAGISFKGADCVQSAIWHQRGVDAFAIGTNPTTTDLTVSGVVKRFTIANDGTASFLGPSVVNAGEYYALTNKLVLHLGNIGTNAASLQAAVASASAPIIGTHAQMVAYTPPTGTTPYWYATDDLASDNILGKLWKWNGSAWIAQGGEASLVIGRVTAAVISAGAIGATALASDLILGTIIRTTGSTLTGNVLNNGALMKASTGSNPGLFLGPGGAMVAKSDLSTAIGLDYATIDLTNAIANRNGRRIYKGESVGAPDITLLRMSCVGSATYVPMNIQWVRWKARIHPSSITTDNLHGIKHLEIEWWDNGATQPNHTDIIALPEPAEINDTWAHTDNDIIVTFSTWHSPAAESGWCDKHYLRCRLVGKMGSSGWRWFKPPSALATEVSPESSSYLPWSSASSPGGGTPDKNILRY